MAIHSFLLLCLLPLAFAVPRIQQEPAYFPWSFAPAEANYQPFPVNYGQKAPASDFFLLDLNRGDLASGNFDIPRMPSRRPQPPSGIVPRSDRLADLPSFGDAAFQKHQPEFMAEPGVRPKFTGSFKTQPVQPQIPSDGPITNPAAYFLQGGNFEKVAPSKCHLKGCAGPVTNDANFVMAPGQNGACTQTFVPLNGCTDGKGYPMGMVCTICCDCMNSFVREMKKTRGFKQGFTSD